MPVVEGQAAPAFSLPEADRAAGQGAGIFRGAAAAQRVELGEGFRRVAWLRSKVTGR